MPDGSLPGGPYPTPPSPDDERVTVAIRNNRPEDIPGLSWGKPDFAAPGHKIIRSFTLDRKKRAGLECVPCAMCSGGHPKFLDGAVLWSSDGWLRVIGHVCAAKPEHFGEAQYRNLRRQRQQEELDAVAFDWLHTNIGVFRRMIPPIGALRSAALFLEAQQRALFRGVPDLAALLAQAASRQGGALTVVQELSGARRDASEVANVAAGGGATQSRYELISVGNLSGGEFLRRPTQKRSRGFETIAEVLERIPPGDGEVPMLALIGRGQLEITVTAGLVLRAVQRALTLAAEYKDASRFIDPANLATLERWGQDSRNTIRFSIRQNASELTFVLEDRSRATISRNWPSLADLYELQIVSAVGTQLDELLRHRSG